MPAISKLSVIVVLLFCITGSAVYGAAELERTYFPSPDELIIYNADLAQLTERLVVSGDEPFSIELPGAMLPESLRVRVDGADIDGFTLGVVTPQGQNYSYNSSMYGSDPYYGTTAVADHYMLKWENAGLDGAELSLTFFAHGISWGPRYTCDILDGDKGMFHYTAAIDNKLMEIEDCKIRLLSGIVGGVEQADWNNMNATQRAGLYYNAMTPAEPGGSMGMISLNVHEIYDIELEKLDRGKLTTLTLFNGELDCTRQFVWDARYDEQVAGVVKVIYKVQNDTEIPFAAGNVAMYQDDIFIGMDSMELTPVGSPGHITMGESMDFRVFRYQQDSYGATVEIPGRKFGSMTKHTVTLEVRYYGDEPTTLEILDIPRLYGDVVIFEEDGKLIENDRYDNVKKFEVDVKKGDKKTVEYVYYTPD